MYVCASISYHHMYNSYTHTQWSGGEKECGELRVAGYSVYELITNACICHYAQVTTKSSIIDELNYDNECDHN